MAYMGSYFGMGIGKSIMIVLLFIIGCFIGLYRKMTSSSLMAEKTDPSLAQSTLPPYPTVKPESDATRSASY